MFTAEKINVDPLNLDNTTMSMPVIQREPPVDPSLISATKTVSEILDAANVLLITLRKTAQAYLEAEKCKLRTPEVSGKDEINENVRIASPPNEMSSNNNIVYSKSSGNDSDVKDEIGDNFNKSNKTLEVEKNLS